MKTRKISPKKSSVKKLSAVSSEAETVNPVERISSTRSLYYDADLFPVDSYAERRFNFWNVIWKRAVIVFGMTTAVTAGSYIWTINQTPEYEGSFQLLIEPRQQTESQPEPSQNQQLDDKSQVLILQSPKLMSGILKQIQTRYPDVTYDSLFDKKTGQKTWGEDKLSIQPLKDTRIVEVSYRDTEPQKIQFILGKIAEGYLNYSLPQEQDQQKKIREEQLKRINQEIAKLEQKQPSIQQAIQSLQQQYNFIDPQLQTQYLAEQNNQLQAQRLETEAQLRQQESSYQTLQKQLGLQPEQALMASALTQSPQYQALLKKLLDLETTIAIESARFNSNAPQIQALLDQRSQILPLLEQEAQRVLGQNSNQVNPEILRFQDSVRLDLIQQLVLAANNIEMLKIRNQVLAKATQDFNQYAQQFPSVVRQYGDLQQQLKTTTDQLKELTTKRQAMQLEVVPETKKAEPWEMIAPPRIPQQQNGELIAVSPNVPFNLALGGLAGLLLGIILAQIVERLNNVYHSTQEVTQNIPLPLLGVIPASNDALMLPAAVAPRVDISSLSYPACSPFQEAFRALNVNLQLLNTDGSIRACVITSATPADGKSTVAMNLAQGAAAMGQRVLLVDADLRCPRIHTLLGLQNQQGLTNVLTQKLEVKSVIQSVPGEENLSILTAGEFYPDPTRLLSSPRMKNIMQQLRDSFDLVIYDTAPILGLADANLLATSTDGLMMVVGLGKTDREAFSLALREVHTAGVPVLGMVANGDKKETHYYRDY